MTKRIAIFGATSGIGRAAMQEALDRGHTVRAFARSADKLEARPGLEAVAGDALDAADVARAITGVDAVIYALGIKESVSMLWKEVSLFSDSTRILLAAMQSADVARLIVVTGIGAGDSKSALSAPERVAHKILLGKPYKDKDRQEAMIRVSDRDWTLVRPGILTNGRASGNLRVLRDPSTWRNGLAPRSEVGRYLVDCVESDEDVGRAVVVVR